MAKRKRMTARVRKGMIEVLSLVEGDVAVDEERYKDHPVQDALDRLEARE